MGLGVQTGVQILGLRARILSRRIIHCNPDVQKAPRSKETGQPGGCDNNPDERRCYCELSDHCRGERIRFWTNCTLVYR